MKDLTVFVITCGEEKLGECIEALNAQAPQSNGALKIEIIRDMHPMHIAFNEMHKRCTTPYFIQVDADVILGEGAIYTLYNAIKKSSFFTYAAYGQLYEEGFGPGGSLRCWKKGIFNIIKFRDVRTVDRDFYKRAMFLGLRRKDVKKVLGTHKPRHSSFSDYCKTKGDIEKWRFLKRPFKRYADPLFRNLMRDTHKNRYRILGFLLGSLSAKKRVYKSKNLKLEKERIKAFFSFMDNDFDNFKFKKKANFETLLKTTENAYSEYSSIKRKSFIKEISGELFETSLSEADLKKNLDIISR